MPQTAPPLITDDQRQQFQEEGYFVLERAIPDDLLTIVRDACDFLIDLMHQEMDRLGTDHIHISHRGRRYHIAKKYDEPPRLSEYVFNDLMADVCRATIGDTAYLFYDQYVAKAAEQGIAFSWHQDGGYLGFPHRPYVTVWAAGDDMSSENGTAWILPFSTAGTRWLVEHVRDPARTLQRILRSLKPGGRIVGETPNLAAPDAKIFGRYWGGGHAPRHLHLFTPCSLERTLRERGFTDIQITHPVHPAHLEIGRAHV